MTEENKAESKKEGGADQPAARKPYRRYRSSRWHKKPQKPASANPTTPDTTHKTETTESNSHTPRPQLPQAQPSTHEKQAAQSGSEAPTPSPPRKTHQRSGRYSSYRRRSGTSQPRVSPSFEAAEASLSKLEYGFTTAFIATEGALAEQFTGSLSTGLKGLKFPGIDASRMKKHLVQAIREKMDEQGKSKVVLGISGGLDSAVTAGIIIEALGRDKVNLVHCIEADRSSLLRSRADAVAQALRCPLEMTDLRPILKVVFVAKPNVTPAARKRRIARERMAALHDIAGAKDALVLGSLNKTKSILGFGTEHGDMAYVFNPLGDLYQSQVLDLARYLKIPRSILENVLRVYDPDGKLWDQDIERLWKELDYYLYQIVDVRISLAHLQKLGMQEEKLFWIYQRIRDSAFQRAQPPVIIAADVYIPRFGEL
ncbi:NAD(+) synthase [bacterium]|nr:NAD(+) synthase [bacterium]